MKSKFYIKSISIAFCILWTFSAFPQNGWERMEDMPQATNYYGSCVDSTSQKAYFFGGGGPSEILNLLDSTQIYDFKTGEWSQGANMLSPASALSAEMINGKIYTIGEALNPRVLTDVKEYDPVNDTWTTKAELPEIFYAHGSCVYDGLIYSFGGRDAGFNLIDTVRTYDPVLDTWNKPTPMPYKRDKSAVCVYNNEIYLFGDNPSLKYTPSTNSWTELNAGTYEVVAYAVPIIHGDTILLFGGYKSGGSYPNPCNEIWAYYPKEDILEEVDTMPFKRFTRGHKYENYVYLFGGHFSNTLGSVTNEVWRFDLDSLKVLDVTGITKTEANYFSVYPNPIKGLLHIDALAIGLHTIEITSLNGQLLYSNRMEGPTHQIDLSSFQKGVYIISIRSKDFVTTEKIIKIE